MSERQLTIMERWSLAIGAPVIAAGILGLWAVLWQMYNTQAELNHQIARITDALENTYTESDAERDLADLGFRLETQSSVMDFHTERLDEHSGRLDSHDERIRRLEGRGAWRQGGGEETP